MYKPIVLLEGRGRAVAVAAGRETCHGRRKEERKVAIGFVGVRDLYTPKSDSHDCSVCRKVVEKPVSVIDVRVQRQNLAKDAWTKKTQLGKFGRLGRARIISDLSVFTRILSDAVLTGHKGKDKIFDGLKAYIEQSAPNTGRAFHFSMTYFWIQIVHLGIQNVANQNATSPQEKPVLSSSKDQFARFLLLNPYVADGTLWTNYYSVECMMGGKARSEMVLPDKKPLPNLVVRDAVTVKVESGVGSGSGWKRVN